MQDIQLSKHFKLSEFMRSSTATKYGIDNTPPLEAIANLQFLCQEILEPLREYMNEPIVISSGYRCPKLNSHPEVRGAKNSQHLTGEAADIRIPMAKAPNGTLIQDLEKGRQYLYFILDHCCFHQVIWEHTSTGSAQAPDHYWLHVSIKRIGENKQEYIPNLLKK